MIAIVGAGVTGLALGHALLARGLDFVILEAASETGGVIRTLRLGGDVLELGPQRTRWTERIARLAAALRIADRVVTAPPDLPLFIVYDGEMRRAPLSPADLLRTDLLPLRAKLRALFEPFAGPPRPDESAADYLSRRFGPTAYGRLLEPLFGGLYGSDPSDMLARHALVGIMRDFGIERTVLPRMLRAGLHSGRAARSAAPACSFDGGMRTLIHALHRSLADQTRLETAVTRLTPAGASYTLDTEAGTVEAEHVVITCDARAAAGLLQAIAPDAAARLQQLRYNDIVIVHMRSAARLRAVGYQVARTEPLRTRGVTFNEALFGRTGIYTAFLGGARDPDAIAEPDAALGAVAVDEFHRVTAAVAEPIHVSRTRIPAWDRSWTVLEALRLPPRVHLCTNYESRVGIPGRLAAADRLAASLASHAENR